MIIISITHLTPMELEHDTNATHVSRRPAMPELHRDRNAWAALAAHKNGTDLCFLETAAGCVSIL